MTDSTLFLDRACSQLQQAKMGLIMCIYPGHADSPTRVLTQDEERVQKWPAKWKQSGSYGEDICES